MDKLSPKLCFAPIIGIAFGIILAVFLVVTIPSAWKDSWQNDWIPRTLALQSTVIFWCLAVAWRGKRLYCGGTMDATEQERFKNSAVCFGLIMGWIFTLYGYWAANEWIFFVPFALTLIVAVSEVGWGNPFIMIQGKWS